MCTPEQLEGEKWSFVSLPSRSVRSPRLLVSAHDYRDEVLRKGVGLLAWADSKKRKRKKEKGETRTQNPLGTGGPHTHTHTRITHATLEETKDQVSPIRSSFRAPSRSKRDTTGWTCQIESLLPRGSLGNL